MKQVNIEGKDPISIEGKDPIFYESKQQAQTAVEWLVSELKKYDSAGLKDQSNYVIEMPTHILTELEEQAKEMEKEQQGYSEEDLEIIEISSIDANYIPPYQTNNGQFLATKFNVKQFKNK